MSGFGLRLLGALCLSLGGFFTGREALLRARSRLRLACGLAADLRGMAEEIEAFCRPLPELLERLRDRPFFELLWAGFGSEPFPRLWRKAAASLELPPALQETLCAPAEALGRYDAARQAAELRLCAERLDRRAAEMERELSSRQRLLPGLGAALGALLGVVLL